MLGSWELLANGLTVASVILAARNSIQTWWVGILGCAAFAVVFVGTRLYADATLQLFFIGTSATGWWRWARGERGGPLAVRRAPPALLAACAASGGCVTLGYGWLLHRFTDAYAPYPDSAVLAFSVLAQLLLMDRRYESWWFWVLVDAIAVPLYVSRGLHLTAAVYAVFLVNALVALVRWRRWIVPT